jgi:hypothetical protein
MIPYPSIETVFIRNKDTNRLNLGELRNSANSMVKEWTVSEKIDGTNIRVIITLSGIEVRGRGDNAQLHPHLVDAVKSLFDHEKSVLYFTAYRGKDLPDDWSVTFYGEGYGAGIQKGAVYSPSKRFRCFDLMLGVDWWLDDEEMRRICADLNIPVVPHLGYFQSIPTTHKELAALIPFSLVAQAEAGSDSTPAEGVVAKPRVVLKDRHGDRIVWKLTFREFK